MHKRKYIKLKIKHKKRDKKVRINKAKNQNNYIDGSRTVLELDDDEGGIGYARILKTPTMAPRAIRLTPVEVTEDVLTNRRLSNISQRSVKQRVKFYFFIPNIDVTGNKNPFI